VDHFEKVNRDTPGCSVSGLAISHQLTQSNKIASYKVLIGSRSMV
jgi:hypothetical protein